MKRRTWITLGAVALTLAVLAPLIYSQQAYFEVPGRGLSFRSENPDVRWYGYQQHQNPDGTVTAYEANNAGTVTTAIYTLPPNPDADVSITPSGDNAVICYRHYMPFGVNVQNARMLNDILTDSGSDETVAFAIYPDADDGSAITSGKSDDATTDAVEVLDMSPDAVVGPGMYRFCACAQDVTGSILGAGQLVDDEFLDFANVGGVVVGEAANDCTTGTMPSTTGALSAVDNGIFGVKIGP